MVDTSYIAFAARPPEAPGIEVRVNFGVFSGREATPAEVDELARRLLGEVERVSVICERRYEVSEAVEASVHQVRVEVPLELVPGDPSAYEELESRLVSTAERWAGACIADRHAEVTEL